MNPNVSVHQGEGNSPIQRGPGPFGVAMRVDVLRHEMRLRGLTGAALGRLAGLSNATISNALAGRRLHPSTFRKIAAHLARVEVIPGADALADEER